MKLTTKIMAWIGGGLALTLLPSAADPAYDTRAEAIDDAHRIVLSEARSATRTVASELTAVRAAS